MNSGREGSASSYSRDRDRECYRRKEREDEYRSWSRVRERRRVNSFEEKERERSRSRSQSRKIRRKSDDHKAYPSEGYIEPRRLFVGGLPKTTEDVRFRAHFEQFGTLESVQLNTTGSYGFVTFADDESTERALEKRMQEFSHRPGGMTFIEVRRPNPKRKSRR